MKLIDRLFSMEEINGRERCATYLYRWTLIGTRWGNVYLHHFVGDDWSRDLHDHPKRFWSIGLWGRYIEETPTGSELFIAPWIRTFPASHTHRLRLPSGTRSCWTLVIVGRPKREWGFWSKGQWVQWQDYVRGPEAEQRKNCP